MLKSVPLEKIHIEAGAKMVPFAGYNMPLKYTSETEEHHCVRNKAGMFDVSHMGEFFIEGPEALNLIQKVFSNDAAKLFDGKAMYGYLPNEQNGIVDDLLVYRFNEAKYMLVVNASNIEKDWNWISQYNSMNAGMRNESDNICLLAVQGPAAKQVLQPITGVNLDEMKYYTFEVGEIGGASDVIISATGYTGAGGYELYVDKQHAAKLWRAVMEAGKPYGLQPVGLGARDTLRMEMGLCLYGNDIDDTTSPLEAGLSWVTKFTKDFVNADVLRKQKEAGVSRKFIGLKMVERGIPRAGYLLYNANDEEIGKITSGTQSPVLNKGIGLGYVKREEAKPENEIYVGIRNKRVKAEVVKPPLI